MTAGMLTRNEVEREYVVDDHGIIRSVGRFESCPWYAVSLSDAIQGGFQSTVLYFDNHPIHAFYVDAPMREVFALDEDVDVLACTETDTGFFRIEYYTKTRWTSFVRYANKQEAEE